MVLLIVSTLIVGAVTGIMVFYERVFLRGLAGQLLHGLLIILCFGLVGLAYWRFGWKIGVINLVLILIAGNVALSFCGWLWKK